MPYYGFYYFDPTWVLVIVGAVICMIASARVKSTFAKYSKVMSRTGMTGAEAARRLLDSQGIYGVQVMSVAGDLTDHYDPRNKTLKLSQSVYGSTSVAAIGVAAHECGHAIQDEVGYSPLKLRTAFVPVANFGSSISMLLIIAGLIFGARNGSYSLLVNLGILCFSLAVLFQLITLPVEFNASRRALVLLQENGILYQDEAAQTRKVLSAAALTYVAGALSAILQLLRLILLFGGRRNRD
ncbi:zinc metallopeptidase [Qiania dongpingensis]|uniref:Zinc metallopeptidase n=1 Tax=Qiania dongpingensis TaxID=2763669 RepID=A0A7G9G5U3_9FIRM|nr:zinc metallopeptidase [Qiania dongpingensis]QNM06175.1 zinc metallopeptidase [Qiania dongpingensis]